MRSTRRELVDEFARSSTWAVSADERRITFTRDDPAQVVIWTVSDAELGRLRYAAGLGAKSASETSSAGFDFLCIYIEEAIGPFDGTRGTMHGEDLTVVE